jgi:heme/copper-type cytochrome/quinol oxidase subunit 2
VACAELCGQSHYDMRVFLEVMTPEDYAEWLKSKIE